MAIKGNWGKSRSFSNGSYVIDKNGKVRSITIWMPPELYGKIEKRARDHDVPMGAMARKIIERALD